MEQRNDKSTEETIDLIARTVAHINEHMVTKQEFYQLKSELANFQLETEQNFKSVRREITNLYQITDTLES
ncbi:MAG: hypothetical protein ACYC8S_03750 [Minisyncoccota bacterium]